MLVAPQRIKCHPKGYVASMQKKDPGDDPKGRLVLQWLQVHLLEKLIKVNQAGGDQKGVIQDEVRRMQEVMEVHGHKNDEEAEEQ